jgi:two-component system NarL family response regulator
MGAKLLRQRTQAPAQETGADGQVSRGKAAIRLLVADDHWVVREGLIAMLDAQADMRVVAQAENGLEAVGLWRRHRPDITLLDLRMPELDGAGVIEIIRAEERDARFILLTTFDDDEDVYRGVRAGAKAYLLKTQRREELLGCVRAVNAGGIYMPPHIAAKLAVRIGDKELSPREQDVLLLLASGRSNKEIGALLSISETTVKSHVKGLFAKLKVVSRTEAVAAASRRGLLRF